MSSLYPCRSLHLNSLQHCFIIVTEACRDGIGDFFFFLSIALQQWPNCWDSPCEEVLQQNLGELLEIESGVGLVSTAHNIVLNFVFFGIQGFTEMHPTRAIVSLSVRSGHLEYMNEKSFGKKNIQLHWCFFSNSLKKICSHTALPNASFSLLHFFLLSLLNYYIYGVEIQWFFISSFTLLFE